MNSEDFTPEIPNEQLREQIEKNYLGTVIASKKKSIKTTAQGENIVYFGVPAEKINEIHFMDPVMIYDVIRGTMIGCKVVEQEVPLPDASDLQDWLKRPEWLEHSIFNWSENKIFNWARYGSFFGAKPLCVFRDDRRVSPDFAPYHHSPVYKPTVREIQRIFDVPNNGIPIGVLAMNNKPYKPYGEDYVQCPLREELLNKHMVISGLTGQGKTVFLKGLMYQLQQQGYSVIAFDLQGDIQQITQQAKWRKLEHPENHPFSYIKDSTYASQEDLYITEDIFGCTTDTCNPVSLFQPSVKNANLSNNKNNFCLSLDQVKSGQSLALFLPNLSDAGEQGLVALYNYYRHKHSGQHTNLEHFIEFINSRKFEGEDRYSYKWQTDYGPISMNKRAYHKLLSRDIRELQRMDIFDIEGIDSLTIQELVQPGEISIIDLSYFTSAKLTYFKHIYQFFVADLILQERNNLPTEKVCIIIDEGHEVIPNPHDLPPHRKHFGRITANKFENMAREGRKYNIGLIVASQRPDDINRVVYSQCNTKIFFRLDNLGQATDIVPREYREKLNNFNPGYGLMISPLNMKEVVPVKFPRIPTLHKPPD